MFDRPDKLILAIAPSPPLVQDFGTVCQTSATADSMPWTISTGTKDTSDYSCTTVVPCDFSVFFWLQIQISLLTHLLNCTLLVLQRCIVVPRYNRSTYGRRAFFVAGPMTWNSLTDSLRDPSLSIDSFRRQLKTFLFYN